MTPEQYQQIKQIFLAARDLIGDEQAACIDRACSGDAVLKTEVERLLADHQRATAFLDAPVLGVPALLRNAIGDKGKHRSLPTDAFADYTLVRELSHGGQGVVYEALQKATKQKVAIKVLLEGPFASPSARRRFEREIELAAQLKHPNIVSVFHAGQTTDDRQFYVMEYISGMPLNVYAREQKLGLEDALRLFVKVCEAVQYAHQRGIIHRDLKPSNILVDAAGEPKILDFGLAKWLAAPTDSLISQQVMGTLPYMSPEQTKGEPNEVDTRTDIYSLGIVLYEMLTGSYPYTVVGQMATVLRSIAEAEPTPPSRKWTPEAGIASQSGMRGKGDSAAFPKSRLWRRRSMPCPIDGEVQTIVLKALAKEPARRYQSAEQFKRDLENYLSGWPIEARQDSTWYVLQKLAMRNLYATFILVLLLVILMGFASTSFYLYRQTKDARDKVQIIDEGFQRTTSNATQVAEEASNSLRQIRLDESKRLHQEYFDLFLDAWKNDQRDSIELVLRHMQKDCPEYTAMSFLLDESMPRESLSKTLGPRGAAIEHLAVGERFLKAGRIKDAIEAFKKCRENADKDSTWLISLAKTEEQEAEKILQSPANEASKGTQGP